MSAGRSAEDPKGSTGPVPTGPPAATGDTGQPAAAVPDDPGSPSEAAGGSPDVVADGSPDVVADGVSGEAGQDVRGGPRHLRLHAARHAMAAWRSRPAGRLTIAGLLILALIGVGAAAGGYAVPLAGELTGPHAAHSSQPWPSYSPRPSRSAPVGAARPSTAPGGAAAGGRPSDALAGWAEQLADRTGIPMVALQAYGYAELVLASSTPACQLRWTTLAGIGKAESDHGRDGSKLGDDGVVTPPIYGPALTGSGSVQAIRDTDGGQLDGDSTWDRAVGPMQFIPATWQSYAADADADGVSNPQDIDDAALAAARYLCAAGRDLGTAGGWWAAVLSYNTVQQYANDVFTAAEEYSQRSQ